MSVDLLHIILGLTALLFVGVSSILYFYVRSKIIPIIVASEESAELFTRMQTYANHLNTVYELPTFYGDETLQSLLSHTKDFHIFLGRYENIYSFTQPDLIDVLNKVDEEYDKEETEKEE
jgi:hypothetical protein